MANYPVNPDHFLPSLLEVDAGLDGRIQHCQVFVGAPPLQHGEFGILTVDYDILEVNKAAMLDDICAILAREEAHVAYRAVSALGVGLVSFGSPAIRDQIIHACTFDLDSGGTFSVIPHDEGLNMRNPVMSWEVWVMMVNFPLDY